MVYDISAGNVEYIATDRKQTSLDSYFESFTPEERNGIRAVTMDMWEPYVNSKIQTIKKTAYGYRNRVHFKTAIFFHCGGLQLYPV